MKRLSAVLGLGLLIIPLFLRPNIEEGLNHAHSIGAFLASLSGITGGFTVAFIGVMILGILIDGCGYRKPHVLIPMAIIGGLWAALYPSGWFLGVPLMLYSALQRLGFGAPAARLKGQRNRDRAA